jgi:hypothetical protein
MPNNALVLVAAAVLGARKAVHVQLEVSHDRRPGGILHDSDERRDRDGPATTGLVPAKLGHM